MEESCYEASFAQNQQPGRPHNRVDFGHPCFGFEVVVETPTESQQGKAATYVAVTGCSAGSAGLLLAGEAAESDPEKQEHFQQRLFPKSCR